MAKTTKVGKRSCSPGQLSANRANSKRSRGPRTPEGRMRSCMNNFKHGMRSAQTILPGESAALFAQKEAEILAAINPTDAVQAMLADRVVMRNWYRLRGERAIGSHTTEVIEEIFEGAGDRDAREVERLAPLVDTDADAVRQLRAFPAGVTHLLGQWAILESRLAKGFALLATQRRMCFTLSGKRPEQVLRDDPVATKWLRAQIGVMLDQNPLLNEVADFLGGQPPDDMAPHEFTIRTREMAASVLPRSAAFQLLKAYVAEAIAELKAHQVAIEAAADRKRQNAAVAAAVQTTREGIQIWNYIQGVDRGCDAALRRLEIRQKPPQPGPRRTPGGDAPVEEKESTKSEIRNPKGEDAERPRVSTPTMLEPAADRVAPSPVDEPDAKISTVEANSVLSLDPDSGCGTMEAPSMATPEPDAKISTVEANSVLSLDPDSGCVPMEAPSMATPEPDAKISTVEANSALSLDPDSGCVPLEVPSLATPEPDSDSDWAAFEAALDGPVDEDLQRFGPEGASLTWVRRQLEAARGSRGGEGAPVPTPAEDAGSGSDDRRARILEQWNLRMQELSDQIDAHFGIDTRRPGPDPGDSS